MIDDEPDDTFTGYAIDEHGADDNEELDGTAIAFNAAPGSVHDELDPTPNLKIEHQGEWPACTGHAMTTVLECIAGLQAGDWNQIPQLSRKFAWEAGQKLWIGRVNWRDGCTIAAVVKSAMSNGVCRSSVAPYRFNEKSLTSEAYDDAKNYRAQHQVAIESYDAARAFLDGGYGGIVAGVNWTTKMSECGGRMDSRQVSERHRSVGGHAVAIVGFNRDGELLLVNSWGRTWAENGVARVTPDAFDYLCSRPYTVCRGVTDLTGFDKTRTLQSWGMG